MLSVMHHFDWTYHIICRDVVSVDIGGHVATHAFFSSTIPFFFQTTSSSSSLVILFSFFFSLTEWAMDAFHTESLGRRPPSVTAVGDF